MLTRFPFSGIHADGAQAGDRGSPLDRLLDDLR